MVSEMDVSVYTPTPEEYVYTFRWHRPCEAHRAGAAL